MGETQLAARLADKPAWKRWIRHFWHQRCLWIRRFGPSGTNGAFESPPDESTGGGL